MVLTIGVVGACGSFSGTDTAAADAGAEGGGDVQDGAPSALDGSHADGDLVTADAGCDGGVCPPLTGLDNPQALAILGGAIFVSEAAPNGRIFGLTANGRDAGLLYAAAAAPGDVRATPNSGIFYLVPSQSAVHAASTSSQGVLIGAQFLAADDTGVVAVNAAGAGSLFVPTLNSSVAFNDSYVVGGVALTQSYIASTQNEDGGRIRWYRRNDTSVASALAAMFANPTVIVGTNESDMVYFIERGAKRVSRMDLAGASPTVLAAGFTDPRALALSPDLFTLYVADVGDVVAVTLSNDKSQPVVTGLSNISAIAVDATTLYVATAGTLDGANKVMPKTGALYAFPVTH